MGKRYIDLDIAGRAANFRLRIDSALEGSPRATLLRQYLEWLANSVDPKNHVTSDSLLGILPKTPITVHLRNRKYLPGSNIGCFSMGSPASPARWFEIRIAYGPDFHDPIEVEAWLATVPHELFHLGAFAARHHGRVPADLTLAEFRADYCPDVEEMTAEWTAREAMGDEFAPEHRKAFYDPVLLAGDLSWNREILTPVQAKGISR